MERYGERGRRFADQDSLHHLRYLDQALAAGAPRIFEKYALWLRSVLVSRGMCSAHLADNFRLLAAAIRDDSISDAGPAILVLEAGAEVLRYEHGDAGRLQAAEARLLDAIRATPSGAAMREDDHRRRRRLRGARYLVSYAVDATVIGTRAHLEALASRWPSDAALALEQAIGRLPV